MKKTFITTYIAFLINEDNNLVRFSNFKSVDDFKKFLQENHLTYDAGEGNFISTNDDGCTSYVYICEKAYYEETGDIADWDHKGLSNYLYDHGDESLTWGEDYESAWYVLGDYDSTVDETLEKIFNDLKLIDDVEVEIEFPEDYEFGYEAKYYTPAVKINN